MKNLLVATLLCVCWTGVSLAQRNQADRGANERAARAAEREAAQASLREGAARADYNLDRERIGRETANRQDAHRDVERAARARDTRDMQRAAEALDGADRRAASALRDIARQESGMTEHPPKPGSRVNGHLRPESARGVNVKLLKEIAVGNLGSRQGNRNELIVVTEIATKSQQRHASGWQIDTLQASVSFNPWLTEPSSKGKGNKKEK